MATFKFRALASCAFSLFSAIAAAQQISPMAMDDAALREQFRKAYVQSGRSASDEEIDAALSMYKQQQAKIMGAAMAFSQMRSNLSAGGMAAPATGGFGAAQVSQAAAPSIGENELQMRIAAWPKAPRLTSVNRLRDGIEVNGQTQLDAEGRISQYAFDEASGNLGYVVDLPDGRKAVKVSRIGVAAPIKVAVIANSGNAWSAQLATGAVVNGNYFAVQPTGFVISRDASIFVYQAGKGTASYAVPRSYVVTPLQHGNIGTTGYILLEKENATGGNNPLQGMMSSIQAIGKALGANAKEDYALMRLSDARLVPLDVEADGKMRMQGLNCRKRNSFVNDCAQMVSFESLWSDVGTRSRHYYWRIDWLQTEMGPVAVVNEGKVMNAIQLDSGNKIPLFKRAMGINEFDLTRSKDGVVGLSVKLGFSRESVSDLIDAMKHPPQLENQAAAGEDAPAKE